MKKRLLSILALVILSGCQANKMACVYEMNLDKATLKNTIVFEEKDDYITKLEIIQSVETEQIEMLEAFETSLIEEMNVYLQDGFVVESTIKDNFAEVKIKLNIKEMGNDKALLFLENRGGLAYSFDEVGFVYEKAFDIMEMSGYKCK